MIFLIVGILVDIFYPNREDGLMAVFGILCGVELCLELTYLVR